MARAEAPRATFQAGMKRKRPRYWTGPLSMSFDRAVLLHRVDHVEDRQIHRDHHSTDHDAEEYDHHRLEQ